MNALRGICWFRPGEHHPTKYLAERIDKEVKIGKQLGTLGGGNHFLEVVYSEGDDQAGSTHSRVVSVRTSTGRGLSVRRSTHCERRRPSSKISACSLWLLATFVAMASNLVAMALLFELDS